MMKDRAQKELALRLSVANRWFPQLDVDVAPGRGTSEKTLLLTDLDVLSSIPDNFKGFRSVVFDCKTSAKLSAINRALWLAGVLARTKADQGFCILKKDAIALDHRLTATDLNIVLLAEDEFELYARCTSPRFAEEQGHASNMDTWDQLFAISKAFPKLDSALKFLRSEYWMVSDCAEGCRKTLAALKAVQPEMDPARVEHRALFFEFCAIFAHALAKMACKIFKAYLHPANQGDLSEALLVMLYGGREAYQHRNELYKLVKAKNAEVMPPDLSLPEWERFLQFVRQCLDAPFALQNTPLILRECGFSLLRGDTERKFAKTLCAESPQGGRFASLLPSYLAKATKLPPEFEKLADATVLPLLPVK
jgi:hypothetical protein